jgi:hypothetical protein
VIGPSDRTGMLDITPVIFTPDARSYAYCYLRVFSRLLLIAGSR